MPMTKEQEEKCYGCRIEAFVASVEASLSFKWGEGNWGSIAISQLSDAQEELAHGMEEEARQTINRAKWIINNKLTDTKAKFRA